MEKYFEKTEDYRRGEKEELQMVFRHIEGLFCQKMHVKEENDHLQYAVILLKWGFHMWAG